MNSIDDTVDDFNSGVTTLRDAINQANGDTGEDLIVFDRSLFSNPQTITLSQGELDLTHNLDIIAPMDSLTGGDLVTVSGNKASRVFEIESGATVSIDGLIVADGSVMRDGGGIKNSGILSVSNSTISNNSGNNGSGIKNSGTLTLDNSIVHNNSGEGGIFSDKGATLTVSNSTISNNSGGGISNNGIVEVSNSTISGNSAYAGGGILNSGSLMVSNSIITGNRADYAGGIYNQGTMNVRNSTISANIAYYSGASGGGIYNFSTMNVDNSTLSGNSADNGGGGGIYNLGTMNVRDSTLSGNRATYGGGICNNGTGTMNVSNSTISNNKASYGGGIFNGKGVSGYYANYGTVNVSNSTLSGNTAGKSGGGVFSDTSGSTNVRNTIIAANLLNENAINPDVSGTFNSNGYNLIGDSTGSTGLDATGDIVGTSDNPIDPRLAPLDFNGGTTQTIALLPDSPAIDAGDPTVLDTDPITDQRGLPRVSGGRADIGAFEVQV